MVLKPTKFVKYILRYYTQNFYSNFFDTPCRNKMNKNAHVFTRFYLVCFLQVKTTIFMQNQYLSLNLHIEFNELTSKLPKILVSIFYLM